jgi:hypothetical protein
MRQSKCSLFAALATMVCVGISSVSAQETPPAEAPKPPAAAAPKPNANPEATKLRTADAKASLEPLAVVIELTDDVRELKGSLLDTNDMEIKTAFGPVKIPLKEVLGIRMARETSEITTIILHNGDMITGAVDIKNLLVQTSWGKSEINGNNLASIFFAPGLKWAPLKLLAGDRWMLAETAELAPSPNQKVQTPPAPATTAASAPPRTERSVLVAQ